MMLKIAHSCQNSFYQLCQNTEAEFYIPPHNLKLLSMSSQLDWNTVGL